MGQTSIIRTNLSLSVFESASGLVVTVNDRPSLTLGGDWRRVATVLAEVDGTKTREEVAESCTARGVAYEDALEILQFCMDENYVEFVPTVDASKFSAHDLLKYDRQIKNFSTLDGFDSNSALDLQGKLQDAHVVVFGVGGVGGYLALSAAMMGVGKISLIDFDSVELSNTSRQVLYTESDLGQLKIDVAKARLEERNPSVRVCAINRRINSAEDLIASLKEVSSSLGDVDFMFLAADMPRGEIQYFADDACASTGTPWMNLGPHGFSKVSMGPLIIPGTTQLYAELLPRETISADDLDIRVVNSRFEPNIMDSYNGLAAKMGMVEAVKFLTGYRVPTVLNSVVELDASDWSVRIHRLEE